MRYLIISLLVMLSYSNLCSQVSLQDTGEKEAKERISYQEAIAIFDTDSLYSEEQLKKSLTTAQMYLMKNKDTEGLENLFVIASDYAKRTNQIKEYIDLKSNQGQLQISNGKSEEAINLLQKLLDTYTDKSADYVIDRNLEARINKAIGDAYLDLDNLELSTNQYKRSLQISEEDRDTNYMAMCYISLATMHTQLGNIYDAIDYNLKALNILDLEGKGAYYGVGASQVLAKTFQKLGNYEKAMEYAKQMDKICEQKGYSRMGAHAKAHLAKQFKIRNRYIEAKDNYDKALVYFETPNVQLHGTAGDRMIINIKIDMADMAMAQGQLAVARDYISEIYARDTSLMSFDSKLDLEKLEFNYALKTNNISKAKNRLQNVQKVVSLKSEFVHQKQLADMEKSIAETTGNYKLANEKMIKYHSLADSIQNNLKSQLIHNMEGRYNQSQSEKKISQLNLEKEITTTKLNQRNNMLILGGIAICLLAFLLATLYNLYHKNKKNKDKLAAQNGIISAALSDKEILLKEIHHRVKNNLQVISSLLNLQSKFVKDEGTLDAIKASKSRVQSMSLLHQNLYQDDNLKGVQIDKYLGILSQNLFDTYNIQDNIKFTSEIEPISLDIDTVVPIGLITNEIISNALKHAFKGRLEGNIHLSLKEQNEQLLLMIKDDGIGLPDSELPVSSKSLGATLIQSFTDKLDGTITIDNSSGCAITIAINDYHKK